MRHNIIKLTFISALVALMAGCSSQQVRVSDPNSALCTLTGAGFGGGVVALAGAGGPVIAGSVMLGATIGNYICSSDGRPVAQPVQQAAAPAPKPAPAPVVRDTDSDNDGVIDRLDRCPNTPVGNRVNANGCPPILLTLTGLTFAHDSSRIDASSATILDRAVTSLKEANTVNVRIVGHTDSSGTDEYNQKLSERRAIAVRDYLVSKGIRATRLTTSGAGETSPISPNTTAVGRHENRRVELHVVEDNAR